MVARFERYVRGASSRGISSRSQRENLRVRLTGFGGVSFADGVSVGVDDDATNQGVRVRVSGGGFREFQSATHVLRVFRGVR